MMDDRSGYIIYEYVCIDGSRLQEDALAERSILWQEHGSAQKKPMPPDFRMIPYEIYNNEWFLYIGYKMINFSNNNEKWVLFSVIIEYMFDKLPDDIIRKYMNTMIQH